MCDSLYFMFRISVGTDDNATHKRNSPLPFRVDVQEQYVKKVFLTEKSTAQLLISVPQTLVAEGKRGRSSVWDERTKMLCNWSGPPATWQCSGHSDPAAEGGRPSLLTDCEKIWQLQPEHLSSQTPWPWISSVRTLVSQTRLLSSSLTPTISLLFTLTLIANSV